MHPNGQMPEQEAALYAAFQQHCRKRTAAYIAAVADKGYPVSSVLDVIAEHLTDAGDGETCAATVNPEPLLRLELAERRVLVSVAAMVQGVGNYTPAETKQMSLDDGYPLPGALVVRMMLGVPFGPTDTAVHDRLTASLTVDEINWLVCVSASLFNGMGLTAEAVRELNPRWTVDAP